MLAGKQTNTLQSAGFYFGVGRTVAIFGDLFVCVVFVYEDWTAFMHKPVHNSEYSKFHPLTPINNDKIRYVIISMAEYLSHSRHRLNTHV